MKNSDAVLITGRLSKEDAQKTDLFAAERRISRSQVVADAVNHYVDCIECVNCGELNNGKGKVCSCCGKPLFDDTEIKYALLSLIGMFGGSSDFNRAFIDTAKRYRNMYIDKGCKVAVVPIIDRAVSPTQYKIKLAFTLADGKTEITLNDAAKNDIFVNEGLQIPSRILCDRLLDVRKYPTKYMDIPNLEHYIIIDDIVNGLFTDNLDGVKRIE